MITDLQKLIIYTLGAIAIIDLLGILGVVLYKPDYDVNIIVALVSLVSTPIGILGGFLTQKNNVETTTDNINALNDQINNLSDTVDNLDSAITGANTYDEDAPQDINEYTKAVYGEDQP